MARAPELEAIEETLRRTEEQLRHAQKVATVGVVAGGVAHDLNNILAVIVAYSSLALDSLSDNDPLHEDLEVIRAAGERAVQLTRQLLAFSRRHPVDRRVSCLEQITRGMERILRSVLGEGVELSVHADRGLGAVQVDRGQIEQVLMNLVINARDAMPQGGRISIAMTNEDVDASSMPEHPGSSPGPRVAMTVTDTGMGMDDATRGRIFEPFFTTKGGDRGTGLGLSIVRGIVEQTGGHIEVSSEPGKGTTFRIYFPRA
jgi:two-component system cell cycle sensor histidine kinase/response regulator CckA